MLANVRDSQGIHQFDNVIISTLPEPVIPLSYDMRNGESDTYRYWDKQYPDPDSTTDLGELSGGLGDLTDGIIANDNWDYVENLEGTGPYVGWRAINPTITFNFSGFVTIDTVRIHVDNSNRGGVSLPTSVDISMGGSVHSFAIPFDNTDLDPRWLEFSGLGLSGNSLNLTLYDRSPAHVWIMLSEVAFYSGQPTNAPPVANAGADQNVDAGPTCSPVVTLDGSGSTDPDSTQGTNDDIVFFDWYEGATYLGSDDTLDYTFELGAHTIRLVVTDSEGETAEDEVIITVEDNTPPQVTAELVKIGKLNLEDAGKFRVEYGCSDNCDTDLTPTAAIQCSVSRGEEFTWKSMKGFDHLDVTSFDLVVTCEDSSGNIGTAIATP